MAEPINIDADLKNADWPKRTKDVKAQFTKRVIRDADGKIVGVEDVPGEDKPKQASAPWWERERAFNPHHVKSGEHGGEFTSGDDSPAAVEERRLRVQRSLDEAVRLREERQKRAEEAAKEEAKQPPVELQPGSSKIKVRVSSDDADAVSEQLREIGPRTRGEAIDMTGLRALEGYGGIEVESEIKPLNEGAVGIVSKIKGTGPDGRAWTGLQSRVLRPDGVIDNMYFELSGNAPEGLGLDIFANQVDHARREGFTSIQTEAAGEWGGRQNGYFTWPRFGYDGPLRVAPRQKLEDAIRASPIEWQRDQGWLDKDGRFDREKPRRISDLMSTPHGRDLWRRYGSTVNVDFDLRDGSLSRDILDRYLEERGRKRLAAAGLAGRELAAARRAEELRTTPAEDAAIDRVWDSPEIQARIRARREEASMPWWERSRAFNPYHIRTGEHGGEFTSKEADPSGAVAPYAEEELTIEGVRGAEREAAIRAKIDAMARKMGYPPELIDLIPMQGPAFKVGDHDYVTAGRAFTKDGTGRIEIFDSGQVELDSPWWDGLIAHEITHQQFESFLEQARQDYEQVRAHDEALEAEFEKAGTGLDAWRDPQHWEKISGELRDEAKALFPAHEAWKAANFDTLKKSDGVTDYSRAYWEAKDVSSWSQIHETLAEMAHILETEGPDAFKAKTTPHWRRLFRNVRTNWKRTTKRGTITRWDQEGRKTEHRVPK